MVDLEYRTEQAIAMLLHSAAQGEEFFVGQPQPLAVKRLHFIEAIAEEPDVEAIFGKFHFGRSFQVTSCLRALGAPHNLLAARHGGTIEVGHPLP
jgi:hypothetical protein